MPPATLATDEEITYSFYGNAASSSMVYVYPLPISQATETAELIVLSTILSDLVKFRIQSETKADVAHNV
jgi:hypothetical protein